MMTLAWARAYGIGDPVQTGIESLGELPVAFAVELKAYFALAALSRSTRSSEEMVQGASALVFRCRVTLERRIARALSEAVGNKLPDWLFTGSFYGSSKKQGISVRMPLSSCQPTRLCAVGCYAHDALDAAPASIVRGAVNGLIANMFERADDSIREEIISKLRKHTSRAVKVAISEVPASEGSNWTRRPRIRFSHVGEIAAYPAFSNALAAQVHDLSANGVDCVIYTRHPKVAMLDPDLWIVNFSLDPSSYNRRQWIPPYARTVFSAFGGYTDPDASINFLEHHRWVHIPQIGAGYVCPTTLPDSKERTCDGVRCSRCFEKPLA